MVISKHFFSIESKVKETRMCNDTQCTSQPPCNSLVFMHRSLGNSGLI